MKPATPPKLPALHPLANPYTLGFDQVEDITAWQLWWEFNKDPYLRLQGIDTRTKRTGNDDFYLGQGQKDEVVRGGRPSLDTIVEKIVPALTSRIALGGAYEVMQETMIAAAKIDRQRGPTGFPVALRWFLEHNPEHTLIAETATAAFGILGNSAGNDILRELALDETAARELLGMDEVPLRMRAFATYALGIYGEMEPDPDLRRDAVDALVSILDEEDVDMELMAAAMISIGLVPLDVAVGHDVCYCGTCEVEQPTSSLQSQITYLMRHFNSQDLLPVVRAHAATSIARLAETRAEGLPVDLKEAVAAMLIDSLDRHRRQPSTVRQSAVLALGRLGDCDMDKVDQWIRWSLDRSAAQGGPLEKRFALVSMGLAGSRRGDAPDAFAGVADARADLLHHFLKGKKSVKPWSALGLGVMGFWLNSNGQQTSDEVDVAIESALRNCRKDEDLGAYALACGLRRDFGAVDTLLKKLERTRDPSARSYTAVGLGLTGTRQAIEPLQEILDHSGRRKGPDALVKTQAGLALGLIGDSEVVAMLLEKLSTVEKQLMEEKLKERERQEIDIAMISVVNALGGIGDERSIDALVKVFGTGDTSNDVKTAAAVALGKIGDAAEVPWRASLANGTNYYAAPSTLTNPQRTGILDLN